MPHLRRLTVSLAAGLLLAAVAMPGAINAGRPAESAIVVRFDLLGASVGYEDPADELVAVTGPPAELGCAGLGFDEFFTEVQAVDTPPGAIVLVANEDETPLYVYRASGFAELCAAVASNQPLTIVGTGTARFSHTDNDWLGSETRWNAFGNSATGSIVDNGGTVWSFSAVWRVVIEPSEGDECLCRVVQENITLRPRG
ncbi:MAG TPA: hypothetical protein VFX65_04185 [Candidatus Limnocylindrales bacterium]|nr:hypothetical protein [Candidatus Limnocylindrales bacterium]